MELFIIFPLGGCYERSRYRRNYPFAALFEVLCDAILIFTGLAALD